MLNFGDLDWTNYPNKYSLDNIDDLDAFKYFVSHM